MVRGTPFSKFPGDEEDERATRFTRPLHGTRPTGARPITSRAERPSCPFCRTGTKFSAKLTHPLHKIPEYEARDDEERATRLGSGSCPHHFRALGLAASAPKNPFLGFLSNGRLQICSVALRFLNSPETRKTSVKTRGSSRTTASVLTGV